MRKQIFDVCIVGGGPGGGIAAYALTQAGLKVALVEAGRHLQPGVDYGLHAWPWEHVEARRAGQPLPGFRVTAFSLRPARRAAAGRQSAGRHAGSRSSASL